MSKQPEALLLAKWLENKIPPNDTTTFANIAAELRRLHEVNQELVEKLKWAYRYALDHADQEYPFDWAIYCEALYQAIVKAEGNEK